MKKICLIALVALWGIAIAADGLCRNTSGGSFTGTIVWADPVTKTLTIKGRGKIVTFDVSNPTFRGFRRIEDMKEGSYASVSYTRTGIRISRATRGEAASEPAPERTATAKVGKKEAKKKMPRIEQKGTGFRDVDENKDGKVTAVEMSVVISDLTMERFKQYDKNGDGCLNESEYKAALKNR
jgi:hypothetical protein